MAGETTPKPEPAATSRQLTRRRMLVGMGVAGTALALTGIYSRTVESYWVEYHEVPMPVRGLHPDLAGLRIAHLTDLHAGSTSLDFLGEVVAQVNTLKPDLVFCTGDLVTHDANYVEPLARILSDLKAPLLVSLGNHDYGERVANRRRVVGQSLAKLIERQLEPMGAQVLRNRTTTFKRGNGSLWICGLEDVFSGYFDPKATFSGVDMTKPGIVLSHNPDTIPRLRPYKPPWVVCGHTHGGQVRLPLVGALYLPMQHRQWDQGLFKLPEMSFYVSRGVGHLVPIRLFCRPEVPIYKLEVA